MREGKKERDGYLFASSSGVCMFHGIKLDKGVDSNVAERRFKAGRVNRKGDEPSLVRVAQFIRPLSARSADLFQISKYSSTCNNDIVYYSRGDKFFKNTFTQKLFHPSKDLVNTVINSRISRENLNFYREKLNDYIISKKRANQPSPIIVRICLLRYVSAMRAKSSSATVQFPRFRNFKSPRAVN